MKKKLTVEGMSCNHCVMALKNELTDASVNVLNITIGSAEVEGEANAVADEKLLAAVTEAGFKLVKVEELN